MDDTLLHLDIPRTTYHAHWPEPLSAGRRAQFHGRVCPGAERHAWRLDLAESGRDTGEHPVLPVARRHLGRIVCVHMGVSMLCIVAEERVFLSWLHVEVLALVVDEPVDHVLLAFRPAAAGASEHVRRRRVDGESEEIRWFRKVGHEAAVEKKVREDEDVHDEHKEQDYDPAFGGVVDPTRSVLLRSDGCPEVLSLRFLQNGHGVVLHNCQSPLDSQRHETGLMLGPLTQKVTNGASTILLRRVQLAITAKASPMLGRILLRSTSRF
jgi:hypothetical protein